MKLNNKLLYLILGVILICILLLCLFNKKKNVICELKNNSLNTKINVELNKNITFTYNYLFDNMDETVDKYDNVNSYLKRINKLDGVKSNIEQEEKNVNYSVYINFTQVKEDNYKILNITEIIKLKDMKEIMEYYEKQGFTCEVI